MTANQDLHCSTVTNAGVFMTRLIYELCTYISVVYCQNKRDPCIHNVG